MNKLGVLLLVGTLFLGAGIMALADRLVLKPSSVVVSLPIPQPPSWWLIGVIVAAVVVGVLIAFFRNPRRRV